MEAAWREEQHGGWCGWARGTGVGTMVGPGMGTVVGPGVLMSDFSHRRALVATSLHRGSKSRLCSGGCPVCSCWRAGLHSALAVPRAPAAPSPPARDPRLPRPVPFSISAPCCPSKPSYLVSRGGKTGSACAPHPVPGQQLLELCFCLSVGTEGQRQRPGHCLVNLPSLPTTGSKMDASPVF